MRNSGLFWGIDHGAKWKQFKTDVTCNQEISNVMMLLCPFTVLALDEGDNSNISIWYHTSYLDTLDTWYLIMPQCQTIWFHRQHSYIVRRANKKLWDRPTVRIPFIDLPHQYMYDHVCTPQIWMVGIEQVIGAALIDIDIYNAIVQFSLQLMDNRHEHTTYEPIKLQPRM